MVSSKKRANSPAAADVPSHKLRATRQKAADRGPPAPPKARYCKTCRAPMKGHNKADCAVSTLSQCATARNLDIVQLSKNAPAALEAKVAACEEVALAAHTDFISRRIDEVVALVLEATDGEADTAAILAAIADAGLVIPEGKTLADFVPSAPVNDEDEDDADGRAGEGRVDDSRAVTPAPPGNEGLGVDGLSTPPATPRPNEAAMEVAEDGSRGTPPVEAMVVDGTEPSTVPKPAVMVKAAPKTAGKAKTPQYRLKYGWKATPSGILPMDLARNGLKRQEYPTQAEKAKRIPRMFQAMAQKGDTLASRTNGWAFCVFMPRGGAGLMRTWHSQQVESDVPGLLSDVRRTVFEKLQPFREQYLKSLEETNKKAQQELEYWKARSAQKEAENAALREKYGIVDA
ncbi:hypothetical protein AURDEDRAFT_160879 [Auricularia subglabra TFB-10046 SS5]|nr:hypothetical protein AURDEDRAFT_160879 [Auricularia subglabra TFB-10046 SS5]